MFNADLEVTKAEFAKAAIGMRNPTVATIKAGENLYRLQAPTIR